MHLAGGLGLAAAISAADAHTEAREKAEKAIETLDKFAVPDEQTQQSFQSSRFCVRVSQVSPSMLRSDTGPTLLDMMNGH
jgi:hypothetical protein